MDQPKIQEIQRMFEGELPPNSSMDEYLDYILTQIRPVSEDLREVEFWLNKRWMEIREDLDFHEAVLHMFMEDGSYLISVDGNISAGAWGFLGGANSLNLQHGGRNELYDLAFLNDDFLILKKHGDQQRKGKKKYFILGRETSVRNLEWRDSLELLFNVYRNNSRWTTYVAAVLILIAIIIVLSLL